MNFSKIVGKIDANIIKEAENKLTKVFLELGSRQDNEYIVSLLGGDPLIFSLLVPVEHVATLNVPTAATDGKRFYWNPIWLCSKNYMGIRLTCYHEAGHALYMHPTRRGKRDPKLWNIAVDYIVNGMAMEDLLIRYKGSFEKMHKAFVSGLGNYLTLDQCIAEFTNPYAPIPGIENFIPEPSEPHDLSIILPGPDDDRELTEVEKKELDKRAKKYKVYYSDPKLPEEMKRPEKIYDLLFALLPKCEECGRIGVYPMPKSAGSAPTKNQNEKGEKKNEKGNDEQGSSERNGDIGHSHGNDSGGDDSSGSGKGEQPGEGKQPGNNGCSTCGGGFDIFDWGSTVDEHMDAAEEPDKLAKRMSDAIQAAKQMAGRVPKALEDELGMLTAPRIRWQDFIRTKLVKCRAGNSKNDWTKFRSRPMFAGLMVPKRVNNFAKFGCLLDTSASMTREDMAFGISQLQSLDERSEGVVVPADAEIYWSQATKIKNSKGAELSKIKIVGRGGTKYAEFFRDYEKKIGKMDFLIIITDGFLLQDDVAEMKDPGIDVIWLITSASAFKAPFGRKFDLKE